MEGGLTSPPSGDGQERVELPPGYDGPGPRLRQSGAADFGTTGVAVQEDEYRVAQPTRNASAR
eukprot:4727442-Alexandrium_andersonii.AAC.1